VRRVAAVALSFAVLVACGGGPATPVGNIDPGSPETLESKLRAFRGKPAVVNFWATWCEPCKNEMPRIVAAARKYKGRVHFLGVDVEDDTQAAARFAKRYNMPFRSIADTNGAIRRDASVVGLPETQFYSADGDLSFAHKGEIEAQELEDKIDDIIAAS
jgi:thiol-disulfide isomerase/thioredoxin